MHQYPITPKGGNPAPEIATLQATIERQAQAITTQRREIETLRAQLRWTDNLIANPNLTPGQRLTTYATKRELESRRTPPSDEPIPIYIPAIATRAGLSADSTGRNITQLALAGAWERHEERGAGPDGQPRTRVLIAPTPTLFEQPASLTAPTRANQGGKRTKICPECGSNNMIERRIIFCGQCGTIQSESDYHTGDPPHPDFIEEYPHDFRGETSVTPTLDFPAENQADPHSDLHNETQPTRGATSQAPEPPPQQTEDHTTRQIADPNNQEDNQQGGGPSGNLPDGAGVLTAVAGDLDRHIQMQPTGEDKYRWRRGAVTPALAQAHLQGRVTLGAELRRRDGTAQMLLWDADTPDDWQLLLTAAKALAASGAQPLLEQSPAGRGGHLALIFDQPVDPATACAQAQRIAPALAAIREQWPRPSTAGQVAVRLPGGRYRRPGVDAWCPVALAGPDDAPLVWITGSDVAALLISAMTPTTWIPPAAETVAVPRVAEPVAVSMTTAAPAPPLLVISPLAAERSAARACPAAASDPRWAAEIGPRAATMYFWFMDEEVAGWFRQRHPDAREMLPPAPNGYGLAIWRGERTASVGYRDDGGWVDHGAGGQRPDGGRDGGDTLDLYCRLERIDRAEALRRIARQMVTEARAELESAARAGRNPVEWVAKITSPAGWRHYDGLRRAVAAQGPSNAERGE